MVMMPMRAKPAEAEGPLTPSLSLQGRGKDFGTPHSEGEGTSNAAKAATITIPIEGMSCASCVAKIERGLAVVPGVKGASVNLATEKATVEYRPTVTSPAQIEEAIRGLGYTPLVPAAQRGSLAPTLSLEGEGINLNERQRAAYRKLQVRFWVAAALTIPVMILGMADHLGVPISPVLSAWLRSASRRRFNSGPAGSSIRARSPSRATARPI